MRKPFRSPASRLSWLWALLPLLLAAVLAIPLLDVDAFEGDEPASLIAAGILGSGPLSLVDTWTRVSPRQALGWPMLLTVWGRLVGWSEIAVRAFPLFAGLLTLAWVYRTGRDLLSPRASLFATLLLSVSVFFIAYMIHARAFTLVTLFTALSIWSYWRIALHPRSAGRAAQGGLLLGSIGLLYSHYFGALLLPALGLFHLLFVPKNRSWWRPVLLFGLATLVAALQIPLILKGVAYTEHEVLGRRFLAAPALLSQLLSYMTNGLLDLPPTPALLTYAGLTLALVVTTLRSMRKRYKVNAVWLIAFASIVLLSLVIAINEVLRVIAGTRIRYIMPLWPLTALLAGAGLSRLADKYRILATGMLALWLITGAWLSVATEYRYELGYFFRSDNHTCISGPDRTGSRDRSTDDRKGGS